MKCLERRMLNMELVHQSKRLISYIKQAFNLINNSLTVLTSALVAIFANIFCFNAFASTSLDSCKETVI